MKNSLIDAGPVIALFDNSDQYHLKVLNFLREYEGRLISTWPVLTEVSYMLDFNTKTQLDFLDWVRDGGIEVHNLGQWQIGGIREKMEKYSDLPADFADTSLIEVAESRDIENIITLDWDFNVYRLKNGIELKKLLK
ncbi:MAG: PIN domain-containing protein [Balneolaceae bacterium]|nr:PIN domain-containing protein [Balneolaceae bacterium]MDR9407990.1 PIN domain-containing protein [Balneolaceae bacterium]